MADEMNASPEDLAPQGQASPPPDGTPPQAAAPAEAATADLQRELEACTAQAAEYLDGWQRARAEFANYKRRIEKEQSEAFQNATARVIGRFLDLSDDFDRAMLEQPEDFNDLEAVARWAAGVALIHRKLQAVLDAEGVQRIEAAGQQFDPQRHEAVTHEHSTEHAPGEIIGVVRQGYRVGDRVIRPALVRVAR